MMQAFRTENNYRNASRLSAAELRAAMASREILQSTALAFDTSVSSGSSWAAAGL